MPDLSNGRNTDFFFMENEDADAVAKQIVELVGKKLPGYYHVDPMQIQVLTPMQKGVVGATSLNLALQEALNPPEQEIFMGGRGAATVPKDCLRRSGFAFRADDKVMQIRNNYDKEVFNGDIGRVVSVNAGDKKGIVLCRSECDGDETELDAEGATDRFLQRLTFRHRERSIFHLGGPPSAQIEYFFKERK